MKKIIKVVSIIIIIVIVFIYTQNHWLQVSKHSLEYSNLPKSFHGFKIVHISDLHDQVFGYKQKRLIGKINELNPDIVVISGDFIDCRNYDLNKSMDLIYGLTKDYKVYYVTGNHEAWSGKMDEIEKALLEAGVEVLRNEIATITINGEDVDIIGVDDPAFNKALPVYDTDNFSIMLSHRSELVDYYRSSTADIVFSGHSHGGQIRLFGKGLISPNQGFFPAYTEGIHILDETQLIISRGLGNSLFPLRVFNRPEIIFVELVKG